MGTRTLLALSQQLSPAPTQRPCVQLLGKVPVPFRQVLGTLCSAPSQPWGHHAPQGFRRRSPTGPGIAKSISVSLRLAPCRTAAPWRDGEVGEGCWCQPPARGTSVQPGTWAQHRHESVVYLFGDRFTF